MFECRSSFHLEIAMPSIFYGRTSKPPADRELTLSEMLDDPIVIRVMRRDGVARGDVARLFAARPGDRLCRLDRRAQRRRA
jgi:hypothetical protein